MITILDGLKRMALGIWGYALPHSLILILIYFLGPGLIKVNDLDKLGTPVLHTELTSYHVTLIVISTYILFMMTNMLAESFFKAFTDEPRKESNRDVD